MNAHTCFPPRRGSCPVRASAPPCAASSHPSTIALILSTTLDHTIELSTHRSRGGPSPARALRHHERDRRLNRRRSDRNGDRAKVRASLGDAVVADAPNVVVAIAWPATGARTKSGRAGPGRTRSDLGESTSDPTGVGVSNRIRRCARLREFASPREAIVSGRDAGVAACRPTGKDSADLEFRRSGGGLVIGCSRAAARTDLTRAVLQATRNSWWAGPLRGYRSLARASECSHPLLRSG